MATELNQGQTADKVLQSLLGKQEYCDFSVIASELQIPPELVFDSLKLIAKKKPEWLTYNAPNRINANPREVVIKVRHHEEH